MSQQPLTIVIFGASGDLTARKLIPALYHNFVKDRLESPFNVLGVSRSAFSHDEFRQKMQAAAQEFAADVFANPSWEQFAQHLWYCSGNTRHPADYQTLDSFAQSLESGPANRLYYLSTAPSLYEDTINNLGAAGMAQENGGWRRIIVEKPFGYDLASAQALNRSIHAVFEEEQIYRIDHYLGKETAQNLLFFRFANTIFEPIWNRNTIDNVQITVAESVDVGHRADYYDQSGVLRDMFQNHLLQLLALVAMEAPYSFRADAMRDERLKILRSIRPIAVRDTVRGQYEGYCETEGVAADSQTPTYAALKLYIDNWRWKGVPFYLRSGKALAAKTSEITITFREPPHRIFNDLHCPAISPNVLAICIQPNEGMHLRFETKVPDELQQTRSVEMDFKYATYFGDELPDAYERLLLDAIKGDASLFTRSDSIEASWGLIDPIIQAWEQDGGAAPLVSYRKGSWGPTEADGLLAQNGTRWLLSCGVRGG